ERRITRARQPSAHDRDEHEHDDVFGQVHDGPLLPSSSVPEPRMDPGRPECPQAPGSRVTLRVRSPGTFPLRSCPAVTVTLEAGVAGTLSGPSPDMSPARTL